MTSAFRGQPISLWVCVRTQYCPFKTSTERKSIWRIDTSAHRKKRIEKEMENRKLFSRFIKTSNVKRNARHFVSSLEKGKLFFSLLCRPLSACASSFVRQSTVCTVAVPVNRQWEIQSLVLLKLPTMTLVSFGLPFVHYTHTRSRAHARAPIFCCSFLAVRRRDKLTERRKKLFFLFI